MDGVALWQFMMQLLVALYKKPYDTEFYTHNGLHALILPLM